MRSFWISSYAAAIRHYQSLSDVVTEALDASVTVQADNEIHWVQCPGVR